MSLATGVGKAGFDAVLACSRAGELVERWRNSGFEAEVLPFERGFGLGAILSQAALVWSLRRLMKRHGIAVCHINDVEMGKYAAVAARTLGVPVVWTCHGWWYTGTLREHFYRHFVDRITAVSSAVRDALLARGILSGTDVEVINPGVDVSIFRPQPPDTQFLEQLGVPSGQPTVAIVGRFQPIKGHPVFFHAARLIAERCPGVVFLVVGDNVFEVGDEERYRAELRQMVQADTALRESTRFIKFQADVPAVMAAVDILVSASAAESFGMVHIEAMACGKPVVSTDSRGPRDIVVHGETGYLVPPENPEALAEKVIRLLEDEKLRREMGQRARSRAEDLFTSSRVADRYCAVYASLAEVSP